MSIGNNFWASYTSKHIDPIDLIVQAADKERNPISPQIVRDFVLGCQTIYYTVKQINPDILIFPLRGAAPIDWALQELDSENEITTPRLYLRIGERVNIDTGIESGITKPRHNEASAKRRLIRQEFIDFKKFQDGKQRFELGNNNGESKIEAPLLIDEVMSGATLTQAARATQESLEEVFNCSKLHVIAAQDSRGKEKRSKVQNYRDLISSESSEFEVSIVNLPLFYIDRRELLDVIFEPSLDDPYARAKMAHTMHNIEAQEFIKFLVKGVLHPGELLEAINYISAHHTSNVDPNRPIFTYLLAWLEKNLDSRESNHKLDNQSILNWISGVAK